jgi:hypothetical protein
MIRDLGFEILGAPDALAREDAPPAPTPDRAAVALKSRDERLGPN